MEWNLQFPIVKKQRKGKKVELFKKVEFSDFCLYFRPYNYSSFFAYKLEEMEYKIVKSQYS